jgi:hypothetical protein
MRRWIAFACVALAGIASSARAEVYPSRPITVIVPFAAGGPTDSLMRCSPRAATDHRERHRRDGEHRGRPRRAGGAGRLHHEHRQHRDPRHQRRRVQSQIRRHQRSRTGRAAAAHVVPARCAHQHSGEEARRVRHLGQGERKAAGSGNAGGRLDTPRRWNPVQRAHGRAAVVRAVSRRRRRCRTSSPARST